MWSWKNTKNRQNSLVAVSEKNQESLENELKFTNYLQLVTMVVSMVKITIFTYRLGNRLGFYYSIRLGLEFRIIDIFSGNWSPYWSSLGILPTSRGKEKAQDCWKGHDPELSTWMLKSTGNQKNTVWNDCINAQYAASTATITLESKTFL